VRVPASVRVSLNGSVQQRLVGAKVTRPRARSAWRQAASVRDLARGTPRPQAPFLLASLMPIAKAGAHAGGGHALAKRRISIPTRSPNPTMSIR